MRSDHLSRSQRNAIRYRIRATEQGMARKYGISVATVRQVRAAAQPNHPARVAAKARRRQWLNDLPPGLVTRQEVPAVEVPAPKGQLHVEGGADLPPTLG